MRRKFGGEKTAKRKPIYVEARIRAPMERVWTLSQDPDLHPQWDLRFSRIVPLHHDDAGAVDFRYEFRLPLHPIHGTGVSLGTRRRGDGQATSVLKFDTADPLSPIGQGSGYWRYIPTDDGLRFITGYNYQPGMGSIGRTLDPTVIRPALGWATALSFDRLRLWAEENVHPRKSRNRWFLDAGARTGLLLIAGALLGKSRKNQSVLAGLSGIALSLAAFGSPTHWTVPRAHRCLRSAPDSASARVPDDLAGLKTTAERECGTQPNIKD